MGLSLFFTGRWKEAARGRTREFDCRKGKWIQNAWRESGMEGGASAKKSERDRGLNALLVRRSRLEKTCSSGKSTGRIGRNAGFLRYFVKHSKSFCTITRGGCQGRLHAKVRLGLAKR